MQVLSLLVMYNQSVIHTCNLKYMTFFSHLCLFLTVSVSFLHKTLQVRKENVLEEAEILKKLDHVS